MQPDISNQDEFIRRNIDLGRQLCTDARICRRSYNLAGVTITVKSPTASLLDAIDPVLNHARVDLAEDLVSDADIFAIDAAAEGVEPPPAAWPFAEETQQDHQRICWRPDDGVALSSDDSRGIWHLWNEHSSQGLYWIAQVDGLPYWEFASPLRHFIHWACLQHGIAMIHGAVIAHDETGVLLTGRGGSGKSTLTAAAVSEGWKTVGDDFVLLSFSDEGVHAYPIFDVLKLTGMAEQLFAGLLCKPFNPDRRPGDKAMVRLSDAAGDAFVRRIKVEAVLSQSLTGADVSDICPLSKVDAVAALAPSTMNILRTAMQRTLQDCSRLARALPTYKLRVGSNPMEGLKVLGDWMKGELSNVERR